MASSEASENDVQIWQVEKEERLPEEVVEIALVRWATRLLGRLSLRPLRSMETTAPQKVHLPPVSAIFEVWINLITYRCFDRSS